MEVEKQNKTESPTLEGFLNFSKIFRMLRRAYILLAKYEKKRMFVVIFVVSVSAAMPYLQNGLFGKLIDATIHYKATGLDLRSIFTVLVFLIIATAVPNILDLIRSFVTTTFRFNSLRHLNLYFLQKISTLDIATIESPSYQELTQKANERGPGTVYEFVSQSIDNLTHLVSVIVSFVILGFLDKQLLLYAFLGAAPALYVQLRYGKDIYWIWDLNSSNRRKYFNRRNHFSQTTSLIELKLYQLSQKFIGEIKKILESFDDELESAEKSKLSWELFALTMFVVFLGMGMWRIIDLTITGIIPIGQMLFAYATYRSFKGSLGQFFRRIGWVTEYSNYASYWFAIDDLQPKIRESGITKNIFTHAPPKIEFRNVYFRYQESNSNYTLENLSFVVEPGEKIAIVGLSGAGKTTLIKLLCRVYDPESGTIFINGVDLKEINLNHWQQQLGVLFQDYVSYEFTAKEAIGLSNQKRPLNEKKVIEAAQMAKADGFIERLPKKYDQLLWKGFEDGVDLSKGERQRMALARVLYRESPITILDEPTASVDALAEQEIFETLEKLPRDRTVILISHRFSTVKHADNILVIEHGKLIEEGKHVKLMKMKGRYAELYKIQAESYK